jgi:hypothetical protein
MREEKRGSCATSGISNASSWVDPAGDALVRGEPALEQLRLRVAADQREHELAGRFVAEQQRPMRRLQQPVEPVEELAQDDADVERRIEEAGGPEKDAEIWPGGVRHDAVSASAHTRMGANAQGGVAGAPGIRSVWVDPAFAKPA